MTRFQYEDGSALAADGRESMHESPRIRRLRNDLAALEKIRSESSVFDFQATGKPPHQYVITFKGSGLCRDRGKVKIAHYHRVEIKLGASYPRAIPELRWMTPIYHPNISEIGMVCLGGYGTHWVPSVQLDELCVMLWDMVRYFNYDIRSPYNRDAALWVANQTSILFPTDSRPLRDLRVALGRVESTSTDGKEKLNGLADGLSGSSSRSGRPSARESRNLSDSRSRVSRVLQFMERYARAVGERSVQQADSDLPRDGRALLEPAAENAPTRSLDPPTASPNGDTQPAGAVAGTVVCELNGRQDEPEPEPVVIVEAANDGPREQPLGSPSQDEILYIE